MTRKPSYYYRQSAAVPVTTVDSEVKVLLVTTRKGHWIVPKGIVEPGWDPAISAAREAWEEAGVFGPVSGEALGSYDYAKWGGVCSVEVFVMRLEEEMAQWPDDAFRVREWVDLSQALGRVHSDGLRKILRRLPGWLASAADVDWILPDTAGWTEEGGTS